MMDRFDLEDFRVSSELVAVQMQAETPAEVISRLSQILVDQGYAKPTYAQAAIEREETFPTGLPTDGVRVAIPHAGAEHALKPGLAIGTLAKPVPFGELGDADSKLEVSIVFLLCVSEPDAQVYLLQSLIEVYKDAELLRKLQAATTPDLIVDEVNASLAAAKAKAAK
jgi:PTS system galactitol-specific IIA component